MTVRITGNTMLSTTVSLLRPDQSVQTFTTSAAGSFNLATQTLATAGTYTVVIDPSGPNMGNISVRVTSP